MYNYQNAVYMQVLDTWEHTNISESLDNVQQIIIEISNQTQTYVNETTTDLKVEAKRYIAETPVLRDLYSDWLRHYNEAYDWIQPKLIEYSNTTLHYGSGVSLGIVASMIILVFILLRILPAKLKNIGYVLFMLGTSASFYFWYMVNTAITTPAANTLLEYWQYLAVYILVMGVISFAIVYRYGPVTDDRTLSLIQWLMQFVGLVLVYNSTQLREVSCALVILLITIYNFPRVALKNQTCKNIWYKLFPPRIKLLTEDEYICQGNRETKKELEKLRDYCRSPDCKAWKVISKLQDPHRFAEFVEGDSWHVTNDELLDYDSGPDPVPPHLVSDDDDESDMDFALASP